MYPELCCALDLHSHSSITKPPQGNIYYYDAHFPDEEKGGQRD